MAATKSEAVDPLAEQMPSDNTKLRWQESDASKLSNGNVVASAHVQLPVDELCDLLFSPQSAFVVRSHQARRNWDYLETAWGPGDEDGAASGEGWRTEGNVRAVQFSSSGFGIVYTTKDEQRIMKVVPGRLYIIEGCVSTNATYGSSFRPLTLYRLDASDAGGTLLTVSARIIFVRQINSLIRALIDRAADGGMRSNFAAVLVILAKEATVTDGKGARPAAAEEEPVRRSIAAAADQQPAHSASRVAQDPAAASTGERLVALVRTAAGRSRVAAAADSMAGRFGLDVAGCRPIAAVLAALVAFKLLGLLCGSELVAALTVTFAAFLCFAQQPQGQPEEVSAAAALPEKWPHLDISRTAGAVQLSPFTDGPSSQHVLTAHPRKVAGHGAVQLWPPNGGSSGQAWFLRCVVDSSTGEDKPLFNIVLQGGGVGGADDLYLSAACRQRPSLSWFTDATTTWCKDWLHAVIDGSMAVKACFRRWAKGMLEEVGLVPADDGSGCQRWVLHEVACNIYTIAAACSMGHDRIHLAAARRTRAVIVAPFSLAAETDRLWRISLVAQL